MLWDDVYIGSQVICSFMVGLCQTLPTKESEKSTIRRSTKPKRSINRKAHPKAGTTNTKDIPTKTRAREETNGLGLLLALEPRIMFDGAAIVTGAEVVQDQVTQEIDLQAIADDIPPETISDPFTSSVDLLSALSSVATPSDRNEIVFIDTSVEDYHILLEGIDPNAEAILLDSTRDGIEHIAKILGERTDIDAMHIISHGDSGELRLGTGLLNLASMQGKYADELATIKQALTEEADFLIYGCNFGQGDGGRTAAALLAKLTGADIAASNNLTGSNELGGDWDLEIETGTIESTVIVNEQAQLSWSGLLATFNVTNTNDSGAGSLRQAINDANNTVGTDTINIPIGTYNLTSGELSIVNDDVIITGADASTTIIDGSGLDRVFHTQGTITATMSDITIQGGNSNNSGGFFVENTSTLNLTDSIVQNNMSNDGGGLHVHGTANLNRVLFSNNTASGVGGAVYLHGAAGGSLTNVTISGNTAMGNGGGLATDTAISITNSTITLNTGNNGGGIFSNIATTTLSNSIVGGNTANSANDDVQGTFSSDGFNLIENVGGTAGFANDLTGASANLAALADNGGPTQTHALLAGSLAINAGANQSAPSLDSRSTARNEVPDIGAYESTTAAAKIYWTESGSNAIFRSNTDGSAKQQILSGLGSPTGLDVDVSGGKIYWIESATTSLHRANLDGTNVENLDTANLVNPQGIGLDVLNSHIYVADDGNGADDAIRRLNLDGTGFTTIVSSLNGVIRDVAADPTGNKLYFSEFGSGLFDGEIKSTDIGGGAIQNIVTGRPGPTSLALDIANGKIYWSDNSSGLVDAIQRANLDGSNREQVNATGLQDPSGIAIDTNENKVYWSDQTSNFVRRSNLDGTNDEDVATGLNAPRELAVVRIGANLAPTLDLDANDSSGATGNDFQFPFTEGDAATTIADGDPDLVDVDSTTFTSVKLAISGLLDGNAETLTLDGSTFALATTVVGQDTAGNAYNVIIGTSAGGATVTITKQGGGTFSEIEIETLIQVIQYQHTDTNAPTDGNRLIDVIVNDGTADSAAARSTITVNSVNDPPVAFADGFPVAEGSTAILNLANNDSDVDDGLDLTSITIIAGPTNGTIDTINADGTVTYTHNGTETLSDSFTYTIDDLSGVTSNTVTVSLTITPQNDSPVAVANSFTVNENLTNTLNLSGNDSDVDDGLDLTSIQIISGPANGSITSINTNGTVDYTHNGSETAADSFTYTINDLTGATSNTATVNLTITPQNDAPIITSDGGGASANVSILTNNTAVTTVNATDAEMTPLTYSIAGGADAALFTIDTATGVLAFITAPNIQTPGDVGSDNVYDVIVQASDGTATATQEIAVTITDLPVIVLPPTADPPSESPSEGGEDDAGESEDEVPGNVLLPGSNSHGHGSSGNQNSTGDNPNDSNQLNHLAKDDAALIQHLRKGNGIKGTAADLMGLFQQSFDRTTLKSEIASLLETSSGFLKDLDEARDALNDVVATEKTYVASSIAASTGLSVGYVFWLLRSGVLLTALLSSVPAWQFVNPLLVLDSPTKKKRRKNQEDPEDDSVESMFENRTEPTQTSQSKTEKAPSSH